MPEKTIKNDQKLYENYTKVIKSDIKIRKSCIFSTHFWEVVF